MHGSISKRPSSLDTPLSLAVCSAGALFTGLIFVVAALAGNHTWMSSSFTVHVSQDQTTVPPSTAHVYSTYNFIGTTSMLTSTRMCQTSETTGVAPSASPTPASFPSLPTNRPAICGGSSSGAAFALGDLATSYASAGCNTAVGKSTDDPNCSALSTMIGASGFIVSLEVGMILLCALGVVASIGLSVRISRATGETPSPMKSTGTWLRFCGTSMDSPSASMLISGAAAGLGAIFVITWPSALANAMGILAKDRVYMSTFVPARPGYAVESSVNPAPGGGYYIVMAGAICMGWAFLCSFINAGISCAAVCGCGGGGGCCKVPPPSNAAYAAGPGGVAVASPLHHAAAHGAAPAPVPVAVGGGAYVTVPGSPPPTMPPPSAYAAPIAYGGASGAPGEYPPTSVHPAAI